jgi:hypothetical protein
MKKAIATLLCLFCYSVIACEGIVIGFKGNNDTFDHKAFAEYADKQKYCAKSFSWYQTKEAANLINNLTIPYQLYGYSKGAASVSKVLRKPLLSKPVFVITIGAYRTTDVNFDRYKVYYVNYFDSSGIGQRSAGIFLNVSHWEIQREVNKLIK